MIFELKRGDPPLFQATTVFLSMEWSGGWFPDYGLLLCAGSIDLVQGFQVEPSLMLK